MNTLLIFAAMLSALCCTKEPQTTGGNGDEKPIVVKKEISMQSLLRDMVDREALCEFPTDGHTTVQASSYNRESTSPDAPGWFADSDGVGFIRTEQNNGQTEWVIMEDDGPGAITKIWAVCFYYGMDNTTGANIKIYLDGSKEPTINTNFFNLVKGEDFVKPPFAQTSTRAGNLYLPIPYAKSCKVTMDQRAFYNTISHQRYQSGTAVRTFTMDEYECSQSLLDSVGTLLQAGVNTPYQSKSIETINKDWTLRAGQTRSVSLPSGGRAVEKLEIKFNGMGDHAQALRSTVLRMSCDGEQTIWSPVGDFFCNGVGIYPYSMWERQVSSNNALVCRWVMPYKQNATIELVNYGTERVDLSLSVITDSYGWTPNTMYFHSTWRTEEPVPGFPLFDYNLVEVYGRGVYVGDQMTVLNPAEGWWGEGDEKVWVDEDFDIGFPSHFGTGTEDYYGWAGGIVPNPCDEFCVPFLSNVRVASPNSKGYNTCTRTRVLDAIPFDNHLRFDIESSGSVRNSWFHLLYSVNAYWYALPGSTHNREPLPEYAARPIMTTAQLQAYNEESKSTVYTVEGAIEAENLSTWSFTNHITDDCDVSFWGDKSGGKVKSFQSSAKGESVAVRLTEQFTDATVKVALIHHNGGGEWDIYLNGAKVKSVTLRSDHSYMALYDLGSCKPDRNAFEVKFVNTSNGALMGVDYFIVN